MVWLIQPPCYQVGSQGRLEGFEGLSPVPWAKKQHIRGKLWPQLQVDPALCKDRSPAEQKLNVCQDGYSLINHVIYCTATMCYEHWKYSSEQKEILALMHLKMIMSNPLPSTKQAGINE